jgi:hypothetical protein
MCFIRDYGTESDSQIRKGLFPHTRERLHHPDRHRLDVGLPVHQTAGLEPEEVSEHHAPLLEQILRVNQNESAATQAADGCNPDPGLARTTRHHHRAQDSRALLVLQDGCDRLFLVRPQVNRRDGRKLVPEHAAVFDCWN